MLRTLTATLAALLVVLTASVACAQKQEIGEKGEFILGADRLVPLFSYSRTTQGNLGALPPGETGQSITTTQTSLSFFWGGTSPEETFFTAPRIGLDYVLFRNFTIGGETVLFVTTGASASLEQDRINGTTTTTTQQSTTSTIFGIAPRAGYIFRLTDLLSIWARGGISYYTLSNKVALGNNPGSGANQFALDIDPQLVITPMPHLGFTVGTTLDVPLFGQVWQDPNENAFSKTLYFGITAGMIGFF